MKLKIYFNIPKIATLSFLRHAVKHFFFWRRFPDKRKRLSEQDHPIIEFKDLYLTRSRMNAGMNV